MSDSTIFYEGKELTRKQAFVVGNLNRLIRKSGTDQNGLKERLAGVRAAWNRGNALRHERGLTEDQDTEWEFPCGKIRLGQYAEAIESLEVEIRNFDTDIRAHTFRLQNYIDSVTLPGAVSAAEASNGGDGDEDDGTPCTTCCPGGEQADYDSSSSEEDEEDDE